MGTSTMGSDLHSDKQDKLLKLQARKKELEQMLASKNEELYKLCVQEVRLTGVVPPEAPLSPDVPQRERLASVRSGDRVNPCHRLSTPSAGGAAARSGPARAARRPDTACSVRTSHTYPALARPDEPPRRAAPSGGRFAGAHFSSSHPDIAAPPTRPAPLLYQYAAQLKAQSQHLGAPAPARARRGTLQRTQTYHLTSHSDYSQHLDAMTPPAARPPLPLHLQLQVATDDSDSVSMNRFSPLSPPDARPKEKQWYETSLDAPPLRKSASLKRAPSAVASQPYEIMISSGRHSALQSPPALSPGAVSLESPTNLTVIEQGKCIPYREETKPFEMSDFYKYSTKFRQAPAPRPAAPRPFPAAAAQYSRMRPELAQFSPDQWHRPT